MLQVRDIHKIYRHPVNPDNEVHVLKGLDLEVNQGEVLVVIGPSGAGKSTLLHVLGGLDRPTRGIVEYGGKDVYRLNDRTRSRMRNENFGFVFQFYHLLPEFSALENVMLPAMMNPINRDMDKVRSRARDLLERVGLAHRITHKPNELSGGEQQRVAVARAIMNEPDILFCDEPTGNLDTASGQDVIRLLLDLNRDNGQTLMIVTHDDRLAPYAERTVHLVDGNIKNISSANQTK
ncbi:MAG: ABC transporter ATP-binding protein [Candidatus Omnitrophota bacterium]